MPIHEGVPSSPDGWTAQPESEKLFREGFQEQPDGSFAYEVRGENGSETSFSILKYLREYNANTFEPRLNNPETKAQLRYASTQLPDKISKGDVFAITRVDENKLYITYNGEPKFEIIYELKKDDI